MFRIQRVPESSDSFTNSAAEQSECFLSLSISTSSVGTTFLSRYQINTYFSEHTVAIVQIELRCGGPANRGGYERVMIVDSRRYSHVVDPVSGCLVDSLRASVSSQAGAPSPAPRRRTAC